MIKETIVNDIYHALVVSTLSVGYSILGKRFLKISPPSFQKFKLEDVAKLAAITAASEMTRDYLVKQGIIPATLNV